MTSNVILQVHRNLLAYSNQSFGGIFKNVQNYITEYYADGSSAIRFTPLEPFETPRAVEEICRNYREASATQVVDSLLLLPIFICDFLCIHPFNDGNGRLSRLLTTLLLYQNGFMVGRYISIEQKIEQTQDEYYEVLRESSQHWKEGKNDYTHFIKYLLKIFLACYRDLEARLGEIGSKKAPTRLFAKLWMRHLDSSPKWKFSNARQLSVAHQ